MNLVDDELDRRMTEAFAGLDDITVLRVSDAPARRRSRVRPVLLAVGCAAALAAAVVVVASRRGETPVRQAEATVSTPLATRPASTAAAPLDAVAMQRLATAGLLTPNDMPAGSGIRQFGPDGGHPRCIIKLLRQFVNASVPGRYLVTPAAHRQYLSWAWAFVDARTASAALRAVATKAAIDCYYRTGPARASSTSAVDRYDYIRITPIDNLPPIGDDGAVFRVDDKISGADAESADFVFVRSGPVLMVALLAGVYEPIPVATVQAMFDKVAARVNAEATP